MKIYGEIDGQAVHEHELTNANGLRLKVLETGCIITELHVPDRDGRFVDVVLGSADLAAYREDSPYFGAIVGRCANRIANATFELDGKTYTLAANNGPHTLHGGTTGFDKAIWNATCVDGDAANAIEFTHRSPDGDEGFPGTLDLTVRIELTDQNVFVVEMRATTDQATICNLAHHGYWNLEGHDAGSILEHELTLHADRFTPVDDTLIPTGELVAVAGGPMDFRTVKAIGRDLDALGGDPLGVDHNFVVNGPASELRPVAKVRAPGSGIVMDLAATAPGVQLYTGNFMDGHRGKGGASYGKHEAFCLETQHFPDSINKKGVPDWPSVILQPGETYIHRMEHTFSVA